MKIKFRDSFLEEDFFRSVDWNVVPRAGDYVTINGKTGLVKEVHWTKLFVQLRLSKIDESNISVFEDR